MQRSAMCLTSILASPRKTYSHAIHHSKRKLFTCSHSQRHNVDKRCDQCNGVTVYECLRQWAYVIARRGRRSNHKRTDVYRLRTIRTGAHYRRLGNTKRGCLLECGTSYARSNDCRRPTDDDSLRAWVVKLGRRHIAREWRVHCLARNQ